MLDTAFEEIQKSKKLLKSESKINKKSSRTIEIFLQSRKLEKEEKEDGETNFPEAALSKNFAKKEKILVEEAKSSSLNDALAVPSSQRSSFFTQGWQHSQHSNFSS